MKFRGYDSFGEWWENLGRKQCLGKYRFHKRKHIWKNSIITGYPGTSKVICQREDCDYEEITAFGYQQMGFERMTKPNHKWIWAKGGYIQVPIDNATLDDYIKQDK